MGPTTSSSRTMQNPPDEERRFAGQFPNSYRSSICVFIHCICSSIAPCISPPVDERRMDGTSASKCDTQGGYKYFVSYYRALDRLIVMSHEFVILFIGSSWCHLCCVKAFVPFQRHGDLAILGENGML